MQKKREKKDGYCRVVDLNFYINKRKMWNIKKQKKKKKNRKKKTFSAHSESLTRFKIRKKRWVLPSCGFEFTKK